MKKFIAPLIALASISAFAGPRKYVSIDKKVLTAIKGDISLPNKLAENGSTAVLALRLPEIEKLSHTIHRKLRRCGGFITYNSLEEAKVSISKRNKSLTLNLFDYSLSNKDLVTSLVDQVSELDIRSMIQSLSGFETRHYGSESGVESSKHIFDTWSKLSTHRSDVKVEYFKHEQWPQPSIILTVTGSELPEEIVILGGHADSIAMDGEIAPGADDNASGIASVTEVIRLLMSNNFKPKRTIQFMAYAAEEVGLLGSREIARSHRMSKKKVVGVLQLDMTLFKGTKDKDIVLISDFTSKEQNLFIGKLIDEYLKVPWGYSRCGYGCSDHASWSSMGYPASFPFETTMEEHNPNIHTINDTLESAGGTADHAVNFSKLATAYVIEMAN